MTALESVLRGWARPSSATETEKCENAVRMVRDAVERSPQLREKTIEVFSHGSYENNTNVRLASDVDVCVLCTDVCFTDYSFSDGLTDVDVGLTTASYSYSEFKNDLQTALNAKFGARSVKRGDKAFDINENSYRIDADVIGCFAHRRYKRRDPLGVVQFTSGIKFITDHGVEIEGWPKQHIENGKIKNVATGNRFKFVVRILKRLCAEMKGSKYGNLSDPMTSYLIESLVWNVPNEGFASEQYADNVRYALAHIFNNTRSGDMCQDWGDVSELLYLFRSQHAWKPTHVNDFSDAAWRFLGFDE